MIEDQQERLMMEMMAGVQEVQLNQNGDQSAQLSVREPEVPFMPSPSPNKKISGSTLGLDSVKKKKNGFFIPPKHGINLKGEMSDDSSGEEKTKSKKLAGLKSVSSVHKNPTNQGPTMIPVKLSTDNKVKSG